MKAQKIPPTLVSDLATLSRPRQFRDTDPQMLFAIWNMELGVDPDKSLNEVENATVAYDKFKPGISQR
ncbi:MAG: hypothetical protein JJU11_16305 [Candidatus Sumerlaeia bacterium]|nr:hypothetical protein [Candidatus Sumerlaeia bacterium]